MEGWKVENREAELWGLASGKAMFPSLKVLQQTACGYSSVVCSVFVGFVFESHDLRELVEYQGYETHGGREDREGEEG